jgi:repressor LexA
MNVTPKQLYILRRIRDERMTHGYSPTMQELADELGVSKVTVFEHVEALIKKGALLRQPNKARSLQVNPELDLPDEQRNTRLPFVGTIAAGMPIEAVEDPQSIDLEEMFASEAKGSGAGRFVLQVRGDSMIDEHIREGDFVVVEQRQTASSGDTVVALLEDGEATLKKLYRRRGKIVLQPANEAYEPIVVDHCEIQGVVVGVIRMYR